MFRVIVVFKIDIIINEYILLVFLGFIIENRKVLLCIKIVIDFVGGFELIC